MKMITQAEYDSAFKWQNQAKQYPLFGEGIQYYKVIMNYNKWVDCLLYYGADNKLEGILNYYPFDFPPYEKKGNVNIQVKPEKRRQGVASRMLYEGILKFKIDLRKQDYTALGKMFIKNYLRHHKVY